MMAGCCEVYSHSSPSPSGDFHPLGSLENPTLRPSIEALMDDLPITKPLREIMPRNAGAPRKATLKVLVFKATIELSD
jgi:hypothetical protein